MTPQEIRNYNIMCAEFLGYVKTSADVDFCFYEHPEDGLAIQSAYDYAKFEKNKLIEVRSMLFHREWNWIMTVIESIEVLEISLTGKCEKYKCGFLKNSSRGNVLIDVKYDNREEFKGWYSSVSIEMCSPYIYDSSNHETSRFETKKEATIKAISEFLIWYKK